MRAGEGERTLWGGTLELCRVRDMLVRTAIVGFGLAVCSLVAVPAVVASPLQQNRAKAQALSAEVTALDARIDAAAQRYSGATKALSEVRTSIRKNRRRQRVARYELDLARSALTARAVALYKHDEPTPLDVVLGVDDFGDLVDQLTMVRRVAQTDRDIVQAIVQTSRELTERAAALDADLRSTKELVARRSAERASMREELDRRSALLDGVRSEIRTLVQEQERVAAEPEPKAEASADSGGGGGSSGGSSGGGGGSGQWWPLIQQAAGANGVNAGGMYRLMMLESGGSATIIGPGGYTGLFQYAPSTWRGSWNPCRSCSITDGAAQIRATAVALRLGYGPSWWGGTYGWAFGGS